MSHSKWSKHLNWLYHTFSVKRPYNPNKNSAGQGHGISLSKPSGGKGCRVNIQHTSPLFGIVSMLPTIAGLWTECSEFILSVFLLTGRAWSEYYFQRCRWPRQTSSQPTHFIHSSMWTHNHVKCWQDLKWAEMKWSDRKCSDDWSVFWSFIMQEAQTECLFPVLRIRFIALAIVMVNWTLFGVWTSPSAYRTDISWHFL